MPKQENESQELSNSDMQDLLDDGAAEESSAKAQQSERGMGGSAKNASVEEVPAEGSDVPALPDFSEDLAQAAARSIELLKDVDLDVKIELGRVEMTVGEILKLSDGSVVELDKLAGDPVDVLVNEQLVARGEVLVINDSFCVRINEIVSGATERFEAM